MAILDDADPDFAMGVFREGRRALGDVGER